MSAVLALVVEWQLLHPTASAEDCRAWLMSENTSREVQRLVTEADSKAKAAAQQLKKKPKTKQS